MTALQTSGPESQPSQVSKSQASNPLTQQRITASKSELTDNDKNSSLDSVKPKHVENEELGYMWAGIKHQEKFNSTPAHAKIMKVFKPYLLAVLFSGNGRDIDILWSDQNNVFLSGVMKVQWRKMATRMGKVAGRRNRDVDSQPMTFESRYVISLLLLWVILSDICSSTIQLAIGGVVPLILCRKWLKVIINKKTVKPWTKEKDCVIHFSWKTASLAKR